MHALKPAAFLPCLAPLALLGACALPSLITPYRIEIQQGNFVSQEMASQLKPGMTREQVRFVLGSPLVADMFHADRWDYVYMKQLENFKGTEQRKLSVFFVDGKLKRVEGDVAPAQPKPASG
jgi:outer membrane protein assembly factor BamE